MPFRDLDNLLALLLCLEVVLGYHELHNEPDGVAEKFTDECIAWVERQLEPPPTPVSERSRM